MAQYKCLECGHIVSLSAKKCMHCGAPNYANFPNMILQKDGSLKHMDLLDQPCFRCGKMLPPKGNRILRPSREGKEFYWWCPECYEKYEKEYCGEGNKDDNSFFTEVIATWVGIIIAAVVGFILWLILRIFG